MRFPDPLLRGRLCRRYKRFFADVALDDLGEAATAHCPNPGAMLGLVAPGTVVWVSRATRKGRTLPYTLELAAIGEVLVGVNTQLPNRIVAEAIADAKVPELAGYDRLRREVPYGQASRVDLVLEADGRPPAYVEVKNVHLRRDRRGGAAEFPDCVTARGARHMDELAGVVAAGGRAVVLFLVQRADCDHFRVAEDLDPGYAKALLRGVRAGVEVVAYGCSVTVDAVTLARSLPVRLDLIGTAGA